MKHVETLRDNFRRISVIRELYESLKSEYESVTDSEAKKHTELKILHAKERILKLTMENKKILERLEVHYNE